MIAQVGHCDEWELLSLTWGDSLITVKMQQPFQELYKSPPVVKFSSLSLWIELDTGIKFRSEKTGELLLI